MRCGFTRFAQCQRRVKSRYQALTLRPRGLCVLQSLKPSVLGSLWLAPSLCVLFIRQTLRSSNRRSPLLDLTRRVFLSCTSPPPRRLDLHQAVFLPVAYVIRSPLSKNSSRKLPNPSAYSVKRTLFVVPPTEETGKKPLPCSLPAPTSGFGYPLVVFRSLNLGSLFQLPTLLGFALQSFAPPQ